MEFYVPFFKYPTIVEFNDIKSWKVINPDKPIKTGDVFLFSGSSLLSSVIKMFTRSKWNHIGMACWCELEHTDGRKTMDLFSFELGSQPYTDLMTREIADKEVRLVRLADIAEMYDMIAFRRMNTKRGPVDGEDWCSRFRDFMWEWKKTPFFDFTVLLKAQYITPGAPTNQTTCAQIAAQMFDRMNIHKLNFDPSQLCPDDYSSSSRAFPETIFIGKETIIYRNPKWIRARFIFILVVLIVVIVILIVLLRKTFKVRKANVK